MMRLDYGPDIQRMKADNLEMLARSKAEDWHINCEWVIGTPGIAPGLGHMTTFNTPYFEKYPALGDWDLIREYLPHARKYGIYVLAYLNMHWYSFEFGNQHADWLQRVGDGRSYGEVSPLYGSGTTFCVNSGWRDWAFLLIKEAMKTGIDGVFLDGPVVFPGCCYCDACKEKFRARTGHDLPEREDWNDPIWKEFIGFRETSMADFLRDAQKALMEVNPEGVIFLNAGSWHGGSWRVARNIEKVGSYQNFNGAEAFFHPGPSEHNLIMWALTAKHLVAGGKPAVVFSHHALGPWHYIPLPEKEVTMSIAQTVACGANPWFAVFDYALDHSREAAVRPVKEIQGFLEKHEDYYTATESAAEVAVLFSSQSSTYYLSSQEGLFREAASGREQDLVADVTVGRTIDWRRRKGICDDMQGKAFFGACYMLTRAHIPYDVILDGHLNDRDLARYRVLVLPNSACLSDEQIAAVSRFVEAGGGLVASFETGCYDALGKRRESPGLAHVLGVSAIEGAMAPTAVEEYIKVKERHPVTGSFSDEQLLARPLYSLMVRAEAGRDVPCVFMNPTLRTYSALKGESPYPGVIAGSFGRGRVVYFPHLLEDSYVRYKIAEHGRWFTNSVLWVYGGPLPLEINAPPTVEVELRRQPSHNRLLVHLVNNTGDMQRPVAELIPIRDIVLDFAPPCPRRVYSLRSGLALEPKSRVSPDGAERFSFVFPYLEDYDVIVIEA